MTLKRKAYDLRRSLVPFVARVLHYGPERAHAPEPWPLPVGHPEIYYEDDVEALRQVMSQGVLYGLCYAAQGWDKRPVLIGREAWSAQSAEHRLWESTRSLELRFSEDAIALCEGLFNVVAKRPPKSSAVRRYSEHTDQAEVRRLKLLDLRNTGDALLAYWMWSGLWKDVDPDAPETRHRGRPAWRALVAHAARSQPLLGLRYGPWVPNLSIDPVSIKASIEGPLRAPMPWLIGHALERWSALDELIWQTKPDSFVEWRTRQSKTAKAWLEQIEATGWYHLAVPFADLYRRAWVELALQALPRSARSRKARHTLDQALAEVSNEAVAAKALARLNTAYGDQRQQDRYALREAWAQHLSTVNAFSALYDKARRIHPADRDPNHAWLVDWWAREGFGAIVERLDDIARRIEGRLG